MADRLQQVPLPVHQIKLMLVPIVGEVGKGSAAGNKGGIDAELSCASIAKFLQLYKTPPLTLAGVATGETQRFGMVVRREPEPLLDSFGQATPAAF